MTASNRGMQFVAAFNDIEGHFRAVLGADEYVPFTTMAREYAEKKRLSREHLAALVAFASLRNAISHSRYYDGRPIAEPVEEVVQQIERLREQIKTPPRALTVLGPMKVCIAGPDDLIGEILKYVRRFDYSQLPVYDDGRYVALLTTNAVARWLANQLAMNEGLAEEERVARVLEFSEPHEQAVLLPRSSTAADAIDRLSRGGPGGRPAAALIITDSGKATEKPLAVIVADDLPRLTAALALA
jgi:hypothetical protein